MHFTDAVETIKGIGEKTAQLLHKERIHTVLDLLTHYPRAYRQLPAICTISTLEDQGEATIKCRVISSVNQSIRNGKQVLMFTVGDGTGNLLVSYFGMPYLKNHFRIGMELILSGRYTRKNGRLFLNSPKEYTQSEYESLRSMLIPVYSCPKGLSSAKMQSFVANALKEPIELKEYLSPEEVAEEELTSTKQALLWMHQPKNREEVLAAKKRLAFDEFYAFFLRMEELKMHQLKKQVAKRIGRGELANKLLASLPYELTKGQAAALMDIEKDMDSGYQMNRLLQGDVGCGKTILSFLAVFNCVSAGGQGAIMAPTEVLAQQHYQNCVELIKQMELPIQVVLLTGSTKQKEKRSIKQQIALGEANIVIGTHAMIQEDVEFANLCMVVCDEQHRFGVAQRQRFLGKGKQVHTLVMSATPIPRTLGLILYGDLDVSVIRELPSNRKPIKNTVVGPEYRPRLYRFIKEQIELGRQAYIICPMVEENEELELENVTEYTEKLRTIFPASIPVQMLHGKMKPKEKQEIMDAFASGDTKILVSTTVVEVGVNVPNATVMMVENAERFGLSQLHQLRGRVGRGSEQSYCIFLLGTNSNKAKERLAIMAKTNDGFEIANEDLRTRGPGDFFGFRQSGVPGFTIADIYNDSYLLERVKNLIERQKAKGERNYLSLLEAQLNKGSLHYLELNEICL